MYKLIGSPKSRAFRVMWMFEELGVDYEMEPARPHSEPVLKVNPAGKVPVLQVGDDAVIDSAAIVQYLADAHGRFTHRPGTIERARQDSFLHFGLDDMDGICWTAAKHTFIFPEARRCQGVKESCAWDWDNAMAAFAKRLGDGDDYVMGDEFTVPDLIIGHCAGWARNSGFAWPDGRVGAYFERVRSRPAFLKAWEIRENS